jgi:hypothetical protein
MDKTQLDSFTDFSTGKECLEKAKQLEALIGIPRRNPFGVRSEADLARKLEDMTPTQLKTMCIDIGVMASGPPSNLRRRIVAEFHKFNNAKLVAIQSPMANKIIQA